MSRRRPKPQPKDYSHLCSWIDDPRTVEMLMNKLPFPIFADVRAPIRDTGKGKVMLLHKIVEKVAGYFPNRRQTIGDCISQGAAYAVDCIKAVDIYIKKDFERWVDLTATEDIYWGSRNVIGKGRLGNGDGSLGVWAAKYVNEYGSLPRGKYGTVDLSTYSGSRAKTWGRAGYKLPKEFVDKIKEHPVEVVSQVKSYEEVRDLVVNGYAVTIASNQGFASRRDAEGFAKPQGSWAHQMCIIGVDDKHRRPGVLVQNSWGTWNGGPKRHDQPDGSFWVDADEIERRVLRSGDCWAFSGYAGFKPQKLNTRII